MKCLTAPVCSNKQLASISRRRLGLCRNKIFCSAAPTKLTNKGWWKPKRLPSNEPTAKPDSFPTKQALDAAFTVSEEQESAEAAVTGQLPAWMRGSFVSNGAGDYSAMKHMFDGYSSLLKVEFKDGKAFASQRFLQSKAYTSYKAAGDQLQYREFMAAPPTTTRKEKFDTVMSMALAMATNQKDSVFTDNASVNIIPLKDGTLFAMSEVFTALYRVDPENLDTLGQVKLDDDIGGDLITAHPSRLADGTLVNFSYAAPFGTYVVYKQDPTTLKRTKIASIPCRSPFNSGWMHSFAVTDNYAILVEPPLYINVNTLTLGEPSPYIFMDWKPKDGTRVHVVPLNGGKVRTYDAPPLFTFHFGNAFESPNGKYIYVDFSVFDDPEILNDLQLVNCRKEFPGNSISLSGYRRLTIPLADEQFTSGLYDVKPELLIPPVPLVEDEGIYNNYSEFPAFNRAYQGKPYRYVYMMSAVRPTNLGNAVVKLDLQDKDVSRWHRPGGIIGEPLFIARPGAEAEDDGAVVFPATDGEGKTSVVVLDAQSFEQLAEVKLPFNVTMRFHASFIPAASQ